MNPLNRMDSQETLVNSTTTTLLQITYSSTTPLNHNDIHPIIRFQMLPSEDVEESNRNDSEAEEQRKKLKNAPIKRKQDELLMIILLCQTAETKDEIENDKKKPDKRSAPGKGKNYLQACKNLAYYLKYKGSFHRFFTPGDIDKCFVWLKEHPQHPQNSYAYWAPACIALESKEILWWPQLGQATLTQLEFRKGDIGITMAIGSFRIIKNEMGGAAVRDLTRAVDWIVNALR